MFIGTRRYNSRVITATKAAGRNQAVLKAKKCFRVASCFTTWSSFFATRLKPSLQGKNWKAEEDYVGRLEEITSGEPIPLGDLFIECGHVPAAECGGRP